ncbi:hypothetical protein RHSIM_Rhsim05G0145800 [Rhododendron simsii]|uniref:Uncharacterized protein n=1 Tax=Rhododendron simsii TaxID=118357 RepID=A0A834GZU7_RHOSS|nr:hypothetical protein RHSIM_Rhsim05G0145800 [Rhododendron simsii]
MKRKNGENVGSIEISRVLDKIKECKSKLTDKKLEMLGKTYDQEREKIRIKQELLEMKQFRADERVIMMDLNCLSEEQQEFYRLRSLHAHMYIDYSPHSLVQVLECLALYLKNMESYPDEEGAINGLNKEVNLFLKEGRRAKVE